MLPWTWSAASQGVDAPNEGAKASMQYLVAEEDLSKARASRPLGQVRRHLDAFAEGYNEDAQPFGWGTTAGEQRRLGTVYSELRN
jgi:hypothetical protein